MPWPAGTTAASYAYDTRDALTSAPMHPQPSPTIPNANSWVNPYHFDGRDGVRYDASTGLDLMRVRAYGPSVGRFLSRDPLERAPLFFADSHSGYSGASPHSNADPRRQYRAASEANKSLMSTYIQAQKSSTTRGASVGLKGW